MEVDRFKKEQEVNLTSWTEGTLLPCLGTLRVMYIDEPADRHELAPSQ